MSSGDVRKTELRQSPNLEVDVGSLERALQCRACEGHRLRGVRRSLGARQGKPGVSCTGYSVAKQPFCPRHPAAGGRLIPPDGRVFACQPERKASRSREVALSAETGIGPLATRNRSLRIAQPPERTTTPVECVRVDVPARVECSVERDECTFPIAGSQRLVAVTDARRCASGVHTHKGRTESRGHQMFLSNEPPVSELSLGDCSVFRKTREREP